VASCRCRRRGARLSGAIAPEQASRTAIDAEAYSQVSRGSIEIRYRQTFLLRGSKSRTAGDHCTRERVATKQSGRELSCSGAAKRAKDATLPVGWIGSEVPLSTCFGLQHFQHLSPPDHICNEALVSDRGLRGMARRCGRCGLKRHSSQSARPNPTT
jgi:hypothetical protein